MIIITFEAFPATVPAATRALYNIEAWVRADPNPGSPGAWSKGDTQSLDVSPSQLRVPAGIGRSMVALRVVKKSDSSVEAAYSDTVNCHTWPSESRQYVTCGNGETASNAPVITPSGWRRTSATASQIPLTISNHNAALQTVIEKRRAGDAAWVNVTTLAAGTTTYNYAPTTTSGFPDQLGEMGNYLEFRCYQLSGTDAKATSAVAQVYCGVIPPTAPRAVRSMTGFDVSWTLAVAQAGAVATTPTDIQAEGGYPQTNITPVTRTGQQGVGATEEQGRNVVTVAMPYFADSQQRFMCYNLVRWSDPTWPIDCSPLVFISADGAAGALGLPKWDSPFMENGVGGITFRAISTIDSASSAQMHFEFDRRDLVSGVSTGWTGTQSRQITSTGQVIEFPAQVDSFTAVITKARIRQSNLTGVGGARVYSEWVEITTAGFEA